MQVIRRSHERGKADHGWLLSYHTFSFAEYYDPKHMGFRSLRVINEDFIEGGQGFGTHPHRDMEIVTYVVDGALEHKDSMGNGTIIRPGEVQYMCAGTGVRHSEFNPSADQATHLLQIWIVPDQAGHTPRYGQKSFATSLASGAMTLVVSSDGRDGSIAIHQDAVIYAAQTAHAKNWTMALKADRHYWLQVISGNLQMTGVTLEPGDALAISQENQELKISTQGPAHWLLFDLV